MALLGQGSRSKILKLTKYPIKFLSIDEIEGLLEHSSVWLKPIIIVLRNTGMRIGELLALRLTDVDLERGNVLVRSSKTNNFRHIPINGELGGTLKWLMEYCVNPKSLKIDRRLSHQKEYIFCHLDGSKGVSALKMVNEMKQDYFVKKCERCEVEIKAPKECPGIDNFLRICQVTCPIGCKMHTFDYVFMRL